MAWETSLIFQHICGRQIEEATCTSTLVQPRATDCPLIRCVWRPALDDPTTGQLVNTGVKRDTLDLDYKPFPAVQQLDADMRAGEPIWKEMKAQGWEEARRAKEKAERLARQNQEEADRLVRKKWQEARLYMDLEHIIISMRALRVAD